MSLKLNNIGKIYHSKGEDFVALRNINLEINPKKIITLTGPSGCGKTTLLNISGLLDSPSTGKILLDNQDITNLKHSTLADFRRKNLGFIFQKFNLIPVMSIFDNIEYPLILLKMGTSERKDRVKQIMRKVGILDLANKLPEQVSGGQQQRAAIARALVKDPRLIIADEPTASLDGKNTRLIFKLLQDMLAEREVIFIMATHDTEAIEHSDKVITIKSGQLVNSLGAA